MSMTSNDLTETLQDRMKGGLSQAMNDAARMGSSMSGLPSINMKIDLGADPSSKPSAPAPQ